MQSTPDWLTNPIPNWDTRAEQQALARQAQLTKPAGALGRLETLAVELAARQGLAQPSAEQVAIIVFAADHGVAVQGVSAYPQAVTAQMVHNFAAGGAAIAVCARALNARFHVCNLGTATPLPELAKVQPCLIAAQTADFTQQPAMTWPQLIQALNCGREQVLALASAPDLFIGGEMGIGNSTAASAMLAALEQLDPATVAGPGTGLNPQQVRHKAAVIEQALQRHRHALTSPLGILQHLGGFEIAALCGAYLTCAQQGITCLVDGFICTVAALLACRINPATERWLLLAHRSAEPAYAYLARLFRQPPLLDLELRLGEGSGAAIAVPLLRLACQLHNQMATFTEAGVDEH